MMFKLKTKTVPVEKIEDKIIFSMFHLFNRYYNNVDQDTFKKDLLEKSHVILLFEKKTGLLKGFSTITNLDLSLDNNHIRGMFSGDTVIDKEFWGQGSLGIAFLIHLFKQKLKKPMTPLYWFLISKGHKTYLLMANNFKIHYPRFEKSTPRNIKKIIDGFSNTLYPHNYKNGTGIISFSPEEKKDFLKVGVAPISKEMIDNNPRIAYFSKVNPKWTEGDELACVAEMTFALPVQYFLKTLKKLFIRNIKGFSKETSYEAQRGYKKL